jgi:hypothetical protein
MINYFTQLFSEMMDRLMGISLFEKKAMMSLDFSDILTGVEDEMSIHGEPCDDFKSFSSMDDYNRDFLSIFEMYGRDIILDNTHKDGHFRV